MSPGVAGEPRWLTRVGIEAIHADQIREHGGDFGLRDEDLLESALSRPRNRFHYEPENCDVYALAASYAFGLAKNHPFVDGNKRVAFVAMALFLELNGHRLEAEEVEAAEIIDELAEQAGEGEEWLAGWIEENSVVQK